MLICLEESLRTSPQFVYVICVNYSLLKCVPVRTPASSSVLPHPGLSQTTFPTYLEPLVVGEEAERHQRVGHEQPVDELLDHVDEGVEGAVGQLRQRGAVVH